MKAKELIERLKLHLEAEIVVDANGSTLIASDVIIMMNTIFIRANKTPFEEDTMKKAVLNSGKWRKENGLYWNWKYGTRTLAEAYDLLQSAPS